MRIDLTEKALQEAIEADSASESNIALSIYGESDVVLILSNGGDRF